MHKQSLTVFWFRRDLRLHDNAALYYALKENENVLPIFIFDKNILNKLEDKNDRRVDFIHQALQKINEELITLQSSLHVFYSTPINVYKKLISQYTIKNVYTNHDYEPYANERDEELKQFFTENNIEFKTYKDQCVFEKNEVVKDDGSPYTVFTPYSRKWKKALTPYYYKPYPNKKYFFNFFKTDYKLLPTLQSMGFVKTDIQLPTKLTLNNLLLQKYKEPLPPPKPKPTDITGTHVNSPKINCCPIMVSVFASDFKKSVIFSSISFKLFMFSCF